MKKHLIYLFLASVFTLTSCSSDDDGGEETQSIVGTWALVSVQPPVFDPAECPQNPTITFNANNTTQSVFYDAENECAADNSTGTWEKLTDNTYRVTIPDFGPTEGTVNFSGANRFTFTTAVQGINVTMTFDKQ